MNAAPADVITATILDQLDAARERLLAVTDLPDQQLIAQHSTLMSPLVWDMAHVANYEELWLVRALGGAALGTEHDAIYDAFENPRSQRPSLPLLDPGEARRYLSAVRRAGIDVMHDAAGRPEVDQRLLVDGFVHGMVVQHEHMHIETMLATRQLMGARSAPPPGVEVTPERPVDHEASGLAAEVVVPAGRHAIGTDRQRDPWALDNEMGAHQVDLPAFAIDTTPVTNGAYLAFVEDGGYDRPDIWDPSGWAWRLEAELSAPQFWRRNGTEWSVERFGRRVALDHREPVQHVCWYEADAYARWAGRRLPTEFEWEVAASARPDGSKTRYPWGDDIGSIPANLGQRTDGPRPVGSNPEGASAWGCHDLLGDVWEWTASEFEAYPGFEAYPYPEYSAVFWGDGYRVLRGGSWAVDPVAIRTTFRNWDLPIRRQIFAGFRCARDLGDD